MKSKGRKLARLFDSQPDCVKYHLCTREKVNPVRNSRGALNPAGIIVKSNPAAAAGPEGLWPGGSSGAFFLTG